MWCTHTLLDRLAGLFEAAGYRTHRFDSPGRGAQPSDDLGRLSLAQYFDHHQAAIEALKLPVPPILIGHSLGGLIAQKLATRMEVSALVLLTPAAPAEVLAITPRGLASLGPFMLRWGFWRKPTQLSRASCDRYGTNGLSPEQQARAFEQVVPDSGRVLFEAALPLLDRNKTTSVPAEQVTCPVYVLGCEDDWLTPPQVVRKVAARYPQATLQMDAQRGHWVVDDDRTPDTVDQIVDWLSTQATTQEAA